MSEATLQILISVLAIAVSFLFSYLAYSRNKNKDTKEDGESKGVMMSEIGYIKAGIDDLKKQNEDTRHKLEDHEVRITRAEENIKALKEG